jgi:hypothetical protein
MPPPYSESQLKDRKKVHDDLAKLHDTHVHRVIEKTTLELFRAFQDWTLPDVPPEARAPVAAALEEIRADWQALKKLNLAFDAPLKATLEGLAKK